jgi:hypothetical protein
MLLRLALRAQPRSGIWKLEPSLAKPLNLRPRRRLGCKPPNEVSYQLFCHKTDLELNGKIIAIYVDTVVLAQ